MNAKRGYVPEDDSIDNPDAVYGFSPSPESKRLGEYAEYDLTDPEGLEKLKQSNMSTYGHEDGPTPDEMFEKYGSWEIVMQKAFYSEFIVMETTKNHML